MKRLTAMLFFAIFFCLTTINVFAQTDDELEERLATIMKQDERQKRSSLNYNSILARVARQKAYDMARRGYFDHVDPDGIGANYLVTQAGYTLPDFYSKEKSANNIELIAAGSRRNTPESVWEFWLEPDTEHYISLLGLTKFEVEKTDYGIGHAYVADSKYKHYWVIIIAKPGGSNDSSTPIRNRNNGSVSSSACSGTPSDYPHVIRGANNNLKPACGYVWVNSDDLDDFRVKLIPGLLRRENGNLYPANGYRWVNPDDPKDYRVEPIP